MPWGILDRTTGEGLFLAWGLGMEGEGLDAWVVVLVVGLEIVTPELFNL